MENRDTPALGEGDIPITIDGEDFVLKPSFQAASQLSRQQGGIMGSIERLVKLDVDTIMQVITVGLGYGGNRPLPREMPERIWLTGFTDDSGGIVDKCVQYLRVLANGGRALNKSAGANPPGS